MSWKNYALFKLSGHWLVMGSAAGLTGWVAARLTLLAQAPSSQEAGLPVALAFGFGLGLILGPVEPLAYRLFSVAWRSALLGGLLGAVCGGLVYAAGIWISMAPLAATLLGLGLMAAAASMAPGLIQKRPLTGVRQAGAMLAGGAVATLLIWWLAAPWLAPVPGVAMALWGALACWQAHFFRFKLTRRWFRVLSGPVEDVIFPLSSSLVVVGRAEDNEVALPGTREVFPYHCKIKWNEGQYEVIDDQQGGVVLVNFRPVENHQLKPGDILKLGSVLLQYGEGGAR